MKIKQSIIDERERSARKKAEIDAEVNNNKEAVYEYVASRKDVIGAVCVKELGFFAKGQRYLEWLTLHGHLVCMKRVIGGKRHSVYNVATPYVKPVTNLPTSVEEVDVKEKIAKVTRVINLMDRPQEPLTKQQREQNRRTSISTGGMQSSLQGFGSW